MCGVFISFFNFFFQDVLKHLIVISDVMINTSALHNNLTILMVEIQHLTTQYKKPFLGLLISHACVFTLTYLLAFLLETHFVGTRQNQEGLFNVHLRLLRAY